nr:PREDICTED: uncharacterized protein LOC109042972 isoform X1 [Bemisia tabaci]
MTSIEVRSKIYEKFVRKLLVVDFDILHVHNKKLRKFFASKQDLDGEFLYSRTDASQKVYIRPKSSIDKDDSEFTHFSVDQDDFATNKREHLETVSDEDDIFLPKKGKREEFTVRSIPSYCLHQLTDEYLYVTVTRGQPILPVLYNLLITPGTSLTARLHVKFERERGAGHGTVKEMFHLALGEIKENVLLEGNIFSKTLKKCTPDLEAGIFNHMGEICAWSMIQGGPSPNFFSRTFATILLHSSEKAKQNLTLEDVLNPAVQREIKAVIDAESLMEINNAMANSTIFQCGETLNQVHGESYLSQRDNAVKGKSSNFFLFSDFHHILSSIVTKSVCSLYVGLM